MCKYHSPTWFAEYDLFFSKEALDTLLDAVEKELSRADEDFLVHHKRKYDGDQYPPAWKTLQVLSFGTLSQLYGNIKNDVAGRKAIALLLFLQLCSVRYLLHTVSPGNHFHVKLKELFVKYPSVEPNRMGFPEGWENEDLWR